MDRHMNINMFVRTYLGQTDIPNDEVFINIKFLISIARAGK